jgi:hypothetical protein
MVLWHCCSLDRCTCKDDYHDVDDKPPQKDMQVLLCFKKGQQLWSNHDVKFCGHEDKYLDRKMSWFHPAHGEKKNELVASSPWRKEK